MVLSLTESLPGFEVVLSSEKDVLQTLVGTIRDCWVDDQNQTGLETSPETRPPVLAVNNFLASLDETLLVVLGLCLLSCSDNGDGDCEDLGDSTRNSTQAELSSGSRGLGHIVRSHVDTPHNAVPVEVRKVGRCDTQESPTNSRVKATDTLSIHDLIDSVQRRLILNFVVTGRILDLNLKLRFDTGYHDRHISLSPLFLDPYRSNQGSLS